MSSLLQSKCTPGFSTNCRNIMYTCVPILPSLLKLLIWHLAANFQEYSQRKTRDNWMYQMCITEEYRLISRTGTANKEKNLYAGLNYGHLVVPTIHPNVYSDLSSGLSIWLSNSQSYLGGSWSCTHTWCWPARLGVMLSTDLRPEAGPAPVSGCGTDMSDLRPGVGRTVVTVGGDLR